MKRHSCLLAFLALVVGLGATLAFAPPQAAYGQVQVDVAITEFDCDLENLTPEDLPPQDDCEVAGGDICASYWYDFTCSKTIENPSEQTVWVKVSLAAGVIEGDCEVEPLADPNPYELELPPGETEIEEGFRVHCNPCSHKIKVINGIQPIDFVDPDMSNNIGVYGDDPGEGNLTAVAFADVGILEFKIDSIEPELGEEGPNGNPTIEVGVEYEIVIEKSITSYPVEDWEGWTGPVDVEVTKEMVIPEGCWGGVLVKEPSGIILKGITLDGEFVPDQPSPGEEFWAEGPVTLDVHLIVEDVPTWPSFRGFTETFYLRCDEPSDHDFEFTNEIEIITEHVFDIDEDNNTDTIDLPLEVLAEADVEILDFYCEVAEFEGLAPGEIPVNEDVTVTCYKTIHNAGPYGPVLVDITGTPVSVPEDCTVDPNPFTGQVELDVSEVVEIEEEFTINCTLPSYHSFVFKNEISWEEVHLSDPDEENNVARELFRVAVIAEADVGEYTNFDEERHDYNPEKAFNCDFPEKLYAKEKFEVTCTKTLHNWGPYGDPHEGNEPVTVTVTQLVAFAQKDCSVTPKELQIDGEPEAAWNGDPFEVELPNVSEDVVVQTTFEIVCNNPSEHGFKFINTIELEEDIHLSDPDLENNESKFEHTQAVWAKTDVSIVEFQLYSPKPLPKLKTGERLEITLQKTVRNSGPYSPVDITAEITATAPEGCTVTPTSKSMTVEDVAKNSNRYFKETFIISCTSAGTKRFTFTNTLKLPEHVEDTNPSNNTKTLDLDVTVEGGAGGGTVTASSSPRSVNFRRAGQCSTVRVTIRNRSGGPINVTGINPQAGEQFNINRITPTLPRAIGNNRTQSFSVRICATAAYRAEQPYFDITTDWGMLAAGLAESEPDSLQVGKLQAWHEGGKLHLWAEGSSGVSGMTLQLFDLQGRLLLQTESSGRYLEAAAMDARGNFLANGVYLYVVTVRGWDGSIIRSEVRKLVILR